jgi:toxin ParE1/3/4
VTYEVLVLPEAQRDLLRLSAFLAETAPHSALQANEVISAAILSLAEMPMRGTPGRLVGTRQIIVRFGQAGYMIRYRVEPRRVTVISIFHTREDR